MSLVLIALVFFCLFFLVIFVSTLIDTVKRNRFEKDETSPEVKEKPKKIDRFSFFRFGLKDLYNK